MQTIIIIIIINLFNVGYNNIKYSSYCIASYKSQSYNWKFTRAN